MANKFHLRARRFCAWIIGFVFMISGVLKLMDPVGAGIIVSEYFNFFHLGFLRFSAKFLGTALALTEAVTGAALMCGTFRKAFAAVASALTLFFSLLTLILLIFNPTMDCGCFGEAIHLSHLQTFIKNMVLLVLCAFAFMPAHGFGDAGKVKYGAFYLVCVSLFAFMVYSWIAIPLKDFTPFKPGEELMAAGSKTPDFDGTRAVFVYEKDGVREEFSLEDVPVDSAWVFVEMKLKTPQKEATGLVLSVMGRDGEVLDDLAAYGDVMVVSAYRKMGERKIRSAQKFLDDARAAGFRPLLLVADDPEGYGEDAYSSDYKTLASLNRSNGGVTFFSDGTLIRKWDDGRRPSLTELQEIKGWEDAEIMASYASKGEMIFQGFLLYIFAVMILL